MRTFAKIAALFLAAALLCGAGVSMAVYGSVDPCTVLAEEQARRARNAAEEGLGVESGPATAQEAVDEARDVLGRASGDVARAGTEAAVEVEDMGAGECAGALWDTWF